MVVEELRNERVDVIQWDEDPAKYVAQALSPARVNRVIIDEDKNYATVIVPDDQLSLAIGKEGQNARLAARLTGWHIDIKSASFNASAPVHEENLLLDEEEDVEEGEFCAYVAEDGHPLPQPCTSWKPFLRRPCRLRIASQERRLGEPYGQHESS